MAYQHEQTDKVIDDALEVETKLYLRHCAEERYVYQKSMMINLQRLNKVIANGRAVYQDRPQRNQSEKLKSRDAKAEMLVCQCYKGRQSILG